MFGRDWGRVSEFVGNNVSPVQCAQHWDSQVDPTVVALKNKSKGPWTTEEVC